MPACLLAGARVHSRVYIIADRVVHELLLDTNLWTGTQSGYEYIYVHFLLTPFERKYSRGFTYLATSRGPPGNLPRRWLRIILWLKCFKR